MTRILCPDCGNNLPVDPARIPAQTFCATCARVVRPVVAEDQVAPPAAELPRFAPQPYRPDGGFSVARLPLYVGVLAVAAVVMGWLASFIGQWFYLVLIFPAAVGAGLVGAAYLGSRLAHFRNPLLGGLLGLLASVLAIVAMHWFNYRRFLKVLGLPGDVLGFRAYLDMSAKFGVSISDIKLGETATWIYWIAEFVVVALLAFFACRTAARQAFCARCNSWKQSRQLGHLSDREEVVEAVRTGDLTRLAQQAVLDPGAGLVLHVSACPQCGTQSPLLVKLQRVTKGTDGAVASADVVTLEYPGEALPSLEAVFQPISAA